MYNKKVIIILIITAILLYNSAPAYSQVPTQSDVDKVTTEADRPVREEAEEKLKVIPKEPPEIEKEEEEVEEIEGVKFFIKKINLVGVESISIEELKPTLEKYENREITFDELKLLTKRIEREYLKKGIIAACFIPPQDIKEGVVILQVVEARMGKLEVKDHKYFYKDRIAYYWELKPGETLRYDKISRSLQFINKNPDRKAKAALRAGKKPGTTDVLVSVDTTYPLHTTFSIDGEGAASTGTWRKNAGFRYNNFLGLDDTLITGYLWGSHFGGIYGYHTVPITNVGTSLMYGYSYTKSNPRGDFRYFDIDVRTKSASVFVYQDLYKKDEYLGDIYFGLDAKNKRLTMRNVGVVNRDRLRIIRTGANFVFREFDNVTYVKPKLSQGIDFLGGRRRDRLSTRNAKNTFTKWNMEIRHSKILPYNLKLGLKLNGQLTATKLASQEQFSLGGIKSVRGYPTGHYLADNAFQTNIELLSSAFFIPKEIKLPYAANPLKDDVTGLLFFDYGNGFRRQRNKWSEHKHVNVASVGTGLRIKLFNQVFLRLEWGFPIWDNPASGSNHGRLHFSLDFEDRIPKEIERINEILRKKI